MSVFSISLDAEVDLGTMYKEQHFEARKLLLANTNEEASGDESIGNSDDDMETNEANPLPTPCMDPLPSDAGLPRTKTKKEKKPTKPSKYALQRDEYGSMIDYLEAKYVRGIVADVEDSEFEEEDSDGSVYVNGDDFIDDTGMIHEVEEQVLASNIVNRTLLGARNDDGNEGFFVNVGDLEMAEKSPDKLSQTLSEDEFVSTTVSKFSSAPMPSQSSTITSAHTHTSNRFLTTQGEKDEVSERALRQKSVL